MLIVGVLVAVAVPSFNQYLANAKVQAVEHNLLSIVAAEAKYYEDNNNYCTTSSGGCVDFNSINKNLNLSMSSTSAVNDNYGYSCSTAGSVGVGNPGAIVCPAANLLCTFTCRATAPAAPANQVNQVTIDINGNLTCSNTAPVNLTCP